MEFKTYKNPIPKELLLQVIELDRSDFPWPWSEKQWNILNSGRDFLLICMIDDTKESESVVGFSLLDCDLIDGSSHLHKIVVNGKHLGKRSSLDLINEVKASLFDIGVSQVYLEVALGNVRAIKFYEKNGFCVAHRKKKYYNDGQDAIIMTCQI